MYVWLCMMVAGNTLGDEGMVALAPALSKLVVLTSLSLDSTWLAMRLWVHWRVVALGCVWACEGGHGVLCDNVVELVVVHDGCRQRAW